MVESLAFAPTLGTSLFDRNMKKAPIKILHTSDVHLDCRDREREADGYRNVSERAFATVIDLTLSESADLFLIAGDLFDSNRVRESDFEFVYEQLQRVECPVVLIPGNHDLHDDTTVWHRFDVTRAGDNVHTLTEIDGKLLDLPEIKTSVWGRAMAEHAPDNVPMEGVTRGAPGFWHIGMAHGDVLGDRTHGCASPITYDEIADSDLDYLALGHVHVWRQHDYGRTRACYPGSPVAEYATSAGGHAAIITLSDEPNIERRKVSERQNQSHGYLAF